jgi:hypothetical protein
MTTSIMEMIAPNGKPLGDCTGDDLKWFSKWCFALVTAGEVLGLGEHDTKGIAMPPKASCKPRDVALFKKWKAAQVRHDRKGAA